MLIRRAEKMQGAPVAMEGVRDVFVRLLVGRADDAPTFAMRHFTVEPGGNTPRHQHNYEHEVFIVEGQARVECDGDFHDVGAGDALFIEANRMHQFVNGGDQPLKFLCLVPVSYDCGGGEQAPTPGS
jgi:quercetin dioxygenase-like cupin family protein